MRKTKPKPVKPWQPTQHQIRQLQRFRSKSVTDEMAVRILRHVIETVVKAVYPGRQRKHQIEKLVGTGFNRGIGRLKTETRKVVANG